VPKFCRHNRLIQNCPICSREQAVELRPLLSSSAPRVSEPRTRSAPSGGSASARRPRSADALERRGVTVRRLRNTGDDGYRCSLVPGLKSSEEAGRLAEEMAFAATRLSVLASDPPGLYADVADPGGDLEQRTWLAFLIAYLYPLDRDDPFAAITAVRTSWDEAEQLRLEDVETGPRTAHEPGRGLETVSAYRAWAERSGSQATALLGDPGWNAERRFSRAFERLALPGLHRDARFELLASLGALGLYELRPGSLALGGANEVTLGAKRALGIGDPLLLDRRAAQLAEACSVPLAALDLALFNWERGERATGGLGPTADPAPTQVDAALAALEL
jgi:hypothetical protein